MANALALVWDLIARDAASPAFLATAASADEAAAATERATVSTRDAGAAADESGGAFLGFGKALVGIAAAVGIVDIGKHMVDSAVKFQSQMLLIQTQAGASAAEVKTMSSAILSLAGPVATAPEQLATSLYHVESTGLRAATALQVVKIAAEGAKVGHADLEETTNALTATVVSGIPGIQNMSQAMGELNAIVGSGDMKLSDLNDALGSGLLTVVKGYGLSITDVGAALATFGDNNIRGADAATMLRMAVQAMAVPIKGGDAVLAKMGITVGELAKDMQTGGLNKALQDLQTHMKDSGVQANQMGEVLTAAFGKRAGPGLAVLEGQMDRFESKLVAVKEGGNGFAAAWTATTQTVSFQFDRLKASLDAIGIRAGTVLLPLVNKGATLLGNGIADAASGTGQALTSDTAKKVYAEIQTAAEDLGAWFQEHRADFARAFTDLKGAAEDVVGWFKDHKSMFASLFDTVKRDLGKTVDTFEHYYSMVGDIVAGIGEWLDTHKKQIHETMADVDKTLRAVGDALQSAFEAVRAVVETVIKIVMDLWDRFGKQLLTHAETALNAVLEVVRGVFEILKGIFDVITGILTGKWSKFWNGIQEIFGGIWNVISGLFKAALNEISQAIGAFVAVFTAIWDALWNAVGTAFFAAWAPISAFFVGLWNTIKSAVAGAVGWLVKTGSDIMTGMWNGITTVWNDIKAFFLGIGKDFAIWLSDAGTWLYDIGKQIMQGMVNGIKAGIGDAVSMVKSAGSSIISAGKSILGINSPSTVFHEIGVNVMQGLQGGINAAASGPVMAVSDVSNRIGSTKFTAANVSASSTAAQTAATNAQLARLAAIEQAVQALAPSFDTSVKQAAVVGARTTNQKATTGSSRAIN